MFVVGTLVGYRYGRRRMSPRFGSGAPMGAGTVGCVDFQDAGAHTGESGCVSGRVLRVFTSRASNTFLDFCVDYRTCPFTSVIFASDRSKFGDLQFLGGRQVEIHGFITVHEGKAEIIIHDPEQIHMVP